MDANPEVLLVDPLWAVKQVFQPAGVLDAVKLGCVIAFMVSGSRTADLRVQVTSRGFLLYLAEQAERMDMPFAFPAATLVRKTALFNLYARFSWLSSVHASIFRSEVPQQTWCHVLLTQKLELIQVTRLDDATAQPLTMQSQGLRLPCILKPLLACGPEWSHDLAIVFNSEALPKAEVNPCPHV